MAVSGIGLTSGDTYRAVGGMVSTSKTTSDYAPIIMTYVDTFNLIGQGPGNNSYLHIVEHMTLNANGDVTVDFVKVRTECK